MLVSDVVVVVLAVVVVLVVVLVTFVLALAVLPVSYKAVEELEASKGVLGEIIGNINC